MGNNTLTIKTKNAAFLQTPHECIKRKQELDENFLNKERFFQK